MGYYNDRTIVALLKAKCFVLKIIYTWLWRQLMVQLQMRMKEKKEVGVLEKEPFGKREEKHVYVRGRKRV